jgi:hypothetical protein
VAKTISVGYTDTPISGVSSLTFPRGILNFTKDFRIKSNNAGKEIVLTNITSPIDRPENIRIAFTDIANIYAGTGVDPSILAPTKRGVSILAQHTDVLSVTDTVDADYRVDLPISAHIVIKVPSSEHVSAAVVQTLVGRLLSSLFDEGVATTSRLESILRGSLAPTGL